MAYEEVFNAETAVEAAVYSCTFREHGPVLRNKIKCLFSILFSKPYLLAGNKHCHDHDEYDNKDVQKLLDIPVAAERMGRFVADRTIPSSVRLLFSTLIQKSSLDKRNRHEETVGKWLPCVSCTYRHVKLGRRCAAHAHLSYHSLNHL